MRILVVGDRFAFDGKAVEEIDNVLELNDCVAVILSDSDSKTVVEEIVAITTGRGVKPRMLPVPDVCINTANIQFSIDYTGEHLG